MAGTPFQIGQPAIASPLAPRAGSQLAALPPPGQGQVPLGYPPPPHLGAGDAGPRPPPLGPQLPPGNPELQGLPGLKQANEGHDVAVEAFDPTQYGMPARYDENGNFIYPEGFDPQTQEWKPGYESQREEWERQYAEAQARFLAHKKQKAEAQAADAAAAATVQPDAE